MMVPAKMSEGGLLVFGARGMLGQSLLAEAKSRGLTVAGAARSGSDFSCDLTDAGAVSALMAQLRPAAVINAAALTDLAACEADPQASHAVNALAVRHLADACRGQGSRLVQISTDHYFSGDGFALHDEHAPVQLLNEYARSKFAGEQFAQDLPDALILRTNITGFRGWPGKPTFCEWVFQVVGDDSEVTLFEDFITSTMSAGRMAAATLTLLDKKVGGLLNVASRQPASKKQFVEALARRMGRPLSRCHAGSVQGLKPPRAESLGLDVSAAEAILGYRLPSLDEVIDSLVSEHQARCGTNLRF